MKMWRIRNRDANGDVTEFPEKTVRQMLQKGLLDDRNQYLPPGENRWLSAAQAVRRLESSSATPVRTEPKSAEKDLFPAAAPQSHAATVVAAELSTHEAAAANVAASNATLSKPVNRQRTIGVIDEDDDELEMTPMIDMTFLLLIFFMVTSSVTPLANLQLPPSKTGRAEETDERVVLVVDFPEALTGADGQSLNGSKFTTLAGTRLYFQDDPQRALAATELDAELQRAFAAKPGSRFILQANRKMPVGVVRQLLKSAAAAGAKETLVGVIMPR